MKPKGRKRGKNQATAEKEARKYLRIALSQETFKKIKAMAEEAGCSPFEVCVSLLEAQLSGGPDASGGGSDA